MLAINKNINVAQRDRANVHDMSYIHGALLNTVNGARPLNQLYYM